MKKAEDLPEFVYLITVENEWPISAVTGNPSSVADYVAAEIGRRCESPNVMHGSDIKVWKVQVTDPVEMEFTPPQKLPATLTPKENVK